MALQKTIENESGVEVTYWKVTGLNLSFTGKRGCVIVGGYLSKETRDADKNHIILRQINIKNVLFDNYFSILGPISGENIIVNSYKYIKENDEALKGSVDC